MEQKTLIFIVILLAFVWILLSRNMRNQSGGDDSGALMQLESNVGPEDAYLISPDYDGYDLYDYYNPYGYYGY